jgi:hypothetical protein
VLLAAFRSIEKPEVRVEFMGAVKEYTDRHRALFKREGRNLAEEQLWRKIFWRELIVGELPIHTTIITASLRETGLVAEEDFDWVIDEATPPSRGSGSAGSNSLSGSFVQQSIWSRLLEWRPSLLPISP